VEAITTSRRNFLRLVGLGVPAAAALAACSGSTPSQTGAGGGSGGGAKGAATYWFLTGQPQQGIREDTVTRFNAANPKSKIAMVARADTPLEAPVSGRVVLVLFMT